MELKKELDNMLNLYNKVLDNRTMIQESIESIKVKINEHKNTFGIDKRLNDELLKSLYAEEKRLYAELDINNLMNNILDNNLLYIKTELLKECKDYFIEHYKNKNIGEKTREKIQGDLHELIYNNYRINIQVYLHRKSSVFDTYEYSLNLDILNDMIVYNQLLNKQYYIIDFINEYRSYIIFNNITYNHVESYEELVGYTNEFKKMIDTINEEIDKKVNDLNKEIDKLNNVYRSFMYHKKVKHVYKDETTFY